MLNNQLHLDTESLSRDILKSCWWIIVVYFLATGLDSLLTLKDKAMFLRETVIVPSLELALITGFLQVWIRYRKEHTGYVLIAGLDLIASVIAVAVYDMPMGIYLVAYPVLISLFFYQKRLLAFACALAFFTLLCIYLFSEKVRVNTHHADLIMVSAMLIGTALLINSLMNRSIRLVTNLIHAVEEKQDLQTKNILMEKITRIDPATELYNHRSFHEHLESVISLNHTGTLHVHLAILDIDNFKQVNDTFGHRAGDGVIAFVAERIKSCLEPDDFASRYGGEEFAVLSVDKSSERFYKQMELIRTSIAGEGLEGLEGAAISISIGIQSFVSGMTKEMLFEGADAALYRAKKGGKNRTVFSDRDIIDQDTEMIKGWRA